MGVIIGQLIRILLLFSFFGLSSCLKPDPVESLLVPNQVKLNYGEQSIDLYAILGSKTYKRYLTSKILKDPNSGEVLKYEGISFLKLVSFVETKYLWSQSKSFEFIAKDGYRIKISRDQLEQSKAFLVVNIPEKKGQKIYNRSLGETFDWKPLYIILDSSKSDQAVSSPYQIATINFLIEEKQNSIFLQADKSLKEGARVFIQQCSKCHQHLGEGGLKGPPIQAVIGAWKNKENLKAFLKNPSQELGRKISMSPIQATEEEIEDLIRYLKSL